MTLLESLKGIKLKTLREILGFFWRRDPSRLQGHASSQHKGECGWSSQEMT